MADDVWKSTADEIKGESNPPLAAGELPKVLDILSESISALTKDFGGHMLAGLGLFVAMFPAIIIGELLFVGAMVPGIVMEDEIVMMLGGVGGFGLFMGIILLVTAPLNASLYRAYWAYLTRGEPLGFGSAFSRMFDDFGSVLLFMVLSGFLSMLGVFACYVGAFAVGVALGLGMPAIIVHRLGAVQAMKFSFDHVKQNPGWHLGFWALGIAIVLVAANVPIIGMMIGTPLYISYQLRGYRKIFGEGALPAAA